MKNKLWLIKHFLFGDLRWIRIEYLKGKLYIDGIRVKDYKQYVLTPTK